MHFTIPAGFVHNVTGQGWVISSLNLEETGFKDLLGPVCSKDRAIKHSCLYFPNIYLVEINANNKYDIFYINENNMPDEYYGFPIQKDIENKKALNDTIKCLLKTEKAKNIYN